MHEAFISYRRSNGSTIAKLLREMLKSRGLSAFMDRDELKNGTFNDKLIDAIKMIPAFLLVLTPNALDGCGDEEDWMTKEILAAIDSGRNIVPVLCDGFQFPKVWADKVPEKIRNLANINGVVMDNYYMDASIDKIVEYIRGELVSKGNKKSVQQTDNSIDIESFFLNRMQEIDLINGVDLAFHAGSEWHEDCDRLDILTNLADAGVKIRVIVNSPEAAESIGQYMRHKLKRYVPFEEAVRDWQNFESMYENVEVRISQIPLLRIYYAFHMQDPEDDIIRVKYYTYGNARIKRNFAQNFEPSNAHYNLYKSEFEFLWDNAEED